MLSIKVTNDLAFTTRRIYSECILRYWPMFSLLGLILKVNYMKPDASSTLPPITAQGSHDLGNGIHFEWLNQGQLAVFDIHQNTREATTTYVEALLSLINTWPSTEPLRLLIIANRRGAEITRYFRERLSEVNAAVADRGLTGRIAILVQRDIFVQVARGILRVQNHFVKSQMPTQFFFERDEALEWVEKPIRS